MSSGSDQRGHRRGVLLVVLAAVLWSTGGLLVRIIEAGEWAVMFWRSVFAAGFLLIYLIATSRTPGQLWRHFTQLGGPGLAVCFCLSADTILFILSVNRTSVANVVIIFSTTPFAAALLAWLVLRERVALRTWAAMGACTLGIAIMVSGSLGRSSLAGDLLALGMAVLFAVPVVIIRRHPEIRMLPAVLLAAVMSAVFSFPFAELLGHRALDYALMGVFGIVEYGLALVAFTLGARYIPAAQSTLIGLLETVLAPVWVWIFVSEVPDQLTLAGGAVVLTSLALYSTYDLRPTRLRR